MRIAVLLSLAGSLSIVSQLRAADPIPVMSRIVSIDLFKNGLAAVRRSIDISPPKDHSNPIQYEVSDVPQPMHGTFWIESDVEVAARVTTREIDSPMRAPTGRDLQSELAGRSVTIRFHDPAMPAVTGTVTPIPTEARPSWNRSYLPNSYGSYETGRMRDSDLPAPFLVLESPSGRTYVDVSEIASLQAEGAAPTTRRLAPVLVFEIKPQKVSDSGDRPHAIAITYLAKGMAWVPSYRLDISESSTLTLTQQSVIRNEMESFDDAEVSLISGFPNIEFGHVYSPLSPGSTLAGFFQQLSQQNGFRHASRADVSSQAVHYSGAGPAEGLDLSALPDGEGVDLHFHPIGRRSMNEGDSLMLNIAFGQTDYERVVEWTVPDTRDGYGQIVNDYQRQNRLDDDSAWDAVVFRNPLSMPMTTAPTMIVSDGRFNGQSLSTWVNAGEQTSVRVTKALSVRTRQFEQEEMGDRQQVGINGRQYRKALVKGELEVSNHRAESITLIIRRQFSGELISADESPKVVLREEGVYSINRRNELTWRLKLDPGEEIKLTYRYSVLTGG